MLPDRVSNPGPLTYESGALPIALRGPARFFLRVCDTCMDYLKGLAHSVTYWIKYYMELYRH